MKKLCNNKTAGWFLFTVFPAVFFSLNAFADDNSLKNLESGLNDLVYNVSRSIVTIEATEPIYPNNYSGVENEAVYNIVSTGIVYDSAGRVVTLAESVIGQSLIAVKFENQIIPAKVQAIDYQTGLALLQLLKPVGVPVKLSRETGCAGQMVLAMGNSLGLRASPSLGFCAGYRADGFMQFSALFSSSTSGGGLFSLSGELIGLISGSIPSGDQNRIGLAVPVSDLMNSVDYMAKFGSRYAGYLGVTSIEIEISPPIEIRLPKATVSSGYQTIVIEKGVGVTDIVPNSPASKSGIRKNDLIFEIDRHSITSAFELARYVKSILPGEIVQIGILRQHQPIFMNVTIGHRELTSINPELNSDSPASHDDMIFDTILKEISNLKKAVKELENKIKR